MQAERRVALVVGNGSYPPSIGWLPNPVNDARAIAEVLEELGFEVSLLEDVGRLDLHRALIAFDRALRDGAVGLFYYAGHAVQVDGRNFMIPVDAALDIPPDAGPEAADYVALETIDLDQVLSRMGIARNRLNIVILDACRDNPFSRDVRSISRGLAQTPAPRGTLIAYATSPGRVALDGPSGSNSIYTAALLDVLRQPGLPLESAFKRVRARVVAETDGRQTPWENSSLVGEFYFRLPEREAQSQPLPILSSGSRDDIAVWSAIEDSPAADDFEIFISAFPQSPLVPFARTRAERLRSADLRPKVSRLERDLQAAEGARQEAVERLADLEAERDRLREDLHEAQEERALLHEKLEQMGQTFAEAEALESKRLKQQLLDERSVSMERLSQAQRLKHEADALRAQLNEERRRVSEQREIIADLRSRLEVNVAVSSPVLPTPAAVEAALNLRVEDRQAIQRALRTLGFDPGPADGDFGAKTRAAITSWQRHNNQHGTGFLTARQRGHLLGQGRPFAAASLQYGKLLADAEPKLSSLDFGTYHALVIGNDAYEHLPDLASAVADANAFGELLKNRYSFQVQILTNASRDLLLSTMNQLSAQLTSEDNLLVYYAGHSHVDNLLAYWVPVEATIAGAKDWISHITIADIVKTMNAKHILLITDGHFFGTGQPMPAPSDPGENESERSEWVVTMAGKQSRHVLTSGYPPLDGGVDGHSPFARALLKALAQNDDLLTGQELYREVMAQSGDRAYPTGFEHLPQYAPIKHAGHQGGDFFFVPAQRHNGSERVRRSGERSEAQLTGQCVQQLHHMDNQLTQADVEQERQQEIRQVIDGARTLADTGDEQGCTRVVTELKILMQTLEETGLY